MIRTFFWFHPNAKTPAFDPHEYWVERYARQFGQPGRPKQGSPSVVIKAEPKEKSKPPLPDATSGDAAKGKGSDVSVDEN